MDYLKGYVRSILFLFFLLMFNLSGASQNTKVEREELNYRAKIVEFQPGNVFVYSNILVDTGEERRLINFKSYAAGTILDKFKIGDEVSIKSQQLKIIRKEGLPVYLFELAKREQLLTISSERAMLNVQEMKQPSNEEILPHLIKNTVFIEKKIKGLYKLNDEIKGLYLESGELLYGQYAFFNSPSLSTYQIGDLISSAGYESVLMKGEVRPIENISVYNFRHLTKTDGIIKSFLIKQNYVYVGLILSTSEGDLRLSFASEKAMELKKLADTKDKVTIYYEKERFSLKNNPPALYAAVKGDDTVRIERPFYGAPDGRHETETVVYSGQIRKLIKDQNNKLSIILTDDALIETNAVINQLRHLIKKGTEIELKGAQRIKRPGEIYEKDYKIIDPESITIDGKEYLIKQ